MPRLIVSARILLLLLLAFRVVEPSDWGDSHACRRGTESPKAAVQRTTLSSATAVPTARDVDQLAGHCDAAGKMGFAWVSYGVRRDGHTEQNSGGVGNHAHDISRPANDRSLRQRHEETKQEFEIVIRVDGSRGCLHERLFRRLIDTQEPPDCLSTQN
jgi:hypothetical protein